MTRQHFSSDMPMWHIPCRSGMDDIEQNKISGRPAMDALSARPPLVIDREHGADHLAPDGAGRNFYAIDRALRDLLPLYLAGDDFRRLEPHFERLGELAGGRLDELARIADKHPPVLHPRDRFGRDEDWIDYHAAYRDMETIAFGDF